MPTVGQEEQGSDDDDKQQGAQDDRDDPGDVGAVVIVAVGVAPERHHERLAVTVCFIGCREKSKKG